MHTMTATHRHGHDRTHAFLPLRWFERAIATRHQRIRLDELDDHLLRDIGIDRTRAQAEAHRPFWDIPR